MKECKSEGEADVVLMGNQYSVIVMS